MPSLATWFTPSLQVLQRSKGRNAVAAAAYRSCTRLNEEQLGTQPDYRSKTGHVSTELFGVAGLEMDMDDIGTLWNKAERSETHKNSAVARELMVPLPHDWTDEQRRLCVRGLAEMLVARYGVAVMASIHRPANGQNDHVHILFTTREVDAQMNFGKKTRVLDDMKTGEVKKMREAVCRVVNEHAEANGADWYVYAGKFADVIDGHIPTAHIPVNAPPELREAMEAENQAIVEAREVLKRIIDESRETSAMVEAALGAAASTAKEEVQAAAAGVPLERSPPPSSEPSHSPISEHPQVQVSTLGISLDLRRAYREVKQALTKRKEVREVEDKWRLRLRELIANPPSLLASMIARGVRALGGRDTVTIHKEEIAKARAAIGQCRKNEKLLNQVIKDPERVRKLREWQEWPEHRKRVDAYEATLPDAPRSAPQALESRKEGFQPRLPESTPVLEP